MTDTQTPVDFPTKREEFDHWPTPDNSTYTKAARAGVMADPDVGLLSPEEIEAKVAEAAAEPVFRAAVEAVWEDRLPTPWAYHQASRAVDKHRERADKAEELLEKARGYVGGHDAGEVDVWSLREVLAGREVRL